MPRAPPRKRASVQMVIRLPALVTSGRRIMSSIGAATTASTILESTAQPGNSVHQEYRMLLPTLPTGRSSFNAVILHCDPSGRPYKIDDFADALKSAINLKDIAGFGAYQYNHVWILTLHNMLAKEKMVKVRQLVIKGKTCVVIDPNTREKTFKVHWLPTNVPDEAVVQAFTSYGKVKKVARDKWRRPGFEEIETTTRTVTIELKEGNTVDSIPHQVTVMGGPALVSIPGRPPLCLRCRKVGHLRKQCRTPWCKVCRTFGHEEDDCVQSYASRTRMAVQEDEFEHYMDQGDMDETGISGGPESSGTPGGQEASINASSVATHPPSQQQPEQQLERQAPLQDDRATPHSEQAVLQTQPEPQAPVPVDDKMELGEASSSETTIKRKVKETVRNNAADQRYTIVSGKRWKKTDTVPSSLKPVEVGASSLDNASALNTT